MSWQAYIDTSLIGSGNVDAGAIISVAGDSVWAASPDFQLSADEMKTIASILKGDSAAKDKAFGEGIYAAGTRYVLAKVDEDEGIYARSGKIGIVAAKSTQAIVIARHPDGVGAGPISVTVTGLTKYLKDQGY
ncbi:profilin domain-containing protein [Sarocladium implicatum]|nr:profilin domain-containing protein [Sarocladium implicatum]